MKITEEKGKDPLNRFMNPESTEKAPEGFSENIMSAIRVESVPIMRQREKIKSRIVPIIFVLIMVVLVIIVLLTSSNEKSLLSTEVEKLLQIIRLPEIKTGTLPGINIPVVVVYISVGMFVLVLFDAGLGKLFHKRP
jgi:hypothetical protein